jgi:hypothetical protein
MANTRCEQDLVGFNPQNTGAVLTIGIETLVNDALVIDTRAITPYSGTVQLSIANELGMTAVFAESGTTALTKTVIAGQVLYIPLKVTATDCGYDRCGVWQFTVYYEADPDYGADTGGEEPTPCTRPLRRIKTCRFDARWPNKCYAKFEEALINVSGEGQLVTRFSLGQSPQCTGPVKVLLTTECEGLDFNATQPTAGVTYTLVSPTELEVTLPYAYVNDFFDININYNSDKITCFCNITATTTYNSCTNPNLFTYYNNGTLSGYNTQAFFNGAGVSARSSTVFTTTINPVAGTALRVQIANPVDYTNPPLPGTAVNTSATDGSILWQGDIAQTTALTTGERYWLRCKGRLQNSLHLIAANELVHLDRYFVSGSGSLNAAIPYFTQYTPSGQWFDNGIRWQATGVTPTITPFARYFQTTLPTALVGDLLLNGNSISDWANIELTKYYPADCIECNDQTLTIKRQECDYETILDLNFAEGRDCVEIQLNDSSLFGYTPGHSQSDFNLYRKVTVTLPDGNQQFLSSVVPYDILINPASVNPLAPFTTFPVSQGGYYEFTLCNVPTFRTDIAYQVDDCVCLIDGTGAIRFFQCIQSRSGITPLVTGGWQNYWVEVTENSLDEKYCDTQSYSNFCFLDDCINEYRNRLYCSIKEFCNVNICDNECIQNYLYLISVKRFLLNGPPFENQRDVLNYLKKLCSTCNCQ